LTAAIGSPAIEWDSSPTKYIGSTWPITVPAGAGAGTTTDAAGSDAVAATGAGTFGSGSLAHRFDGKPIFMLTPPRS
jgi:hypothetical protein